MDTELPCHQRIAVRIHLLYCVWCRRYAAQIQFLRKAAKEVAAGAATPKLSVEAKVQMRQRMQEALKRPRSDG